MVATNPPAITLEAFLKLPETKPASEFVDGKVFQKPMPKRKHSLLQSELCTAINAVTKPEKIAYAFPELRCTYPAGSRSSVYGGRSLVPDIAVLRWNQIQFDPAGEPLDDVVTAPDWVIEILSPNQSSNRVTANIAHCLKHGCQLGWLVDPDDRSILVLTPNQFPELCQDCDRLIIPEMIPLSLTANEVFDWLRLA